MGDVERGEVDQEDLHCRQDAEQQAEEPGDRDPADQTLASDAIDLRTRVADHRYGAPGTMERGWNRTLPSSGRSPSG